MLSADTIVQMLMWGSPAVGGILVWGHKSVMKRLKALDDIAPMVRTLQTQFSPNGGSSLDDAIREIRQQVDRIAELVTISDQRARLVWSSTPYGVYECNQDGECIWVNARLCEMFGLDYQNMIGRGWLSSIDPAEREDVWDAWVASVIKRIPFEYTYTVVNRRNGERRKCTTQIIHHLGDGPIPRGYFGTVRYDEETPLGLPAPVPRDETKDSAHWRS